MLLFVIGVYSIQNIPSWECFIIILLLISLKISLLTLLRVNNSIINTIHYIMRHYLISSHFRLLRSFSYSQLHTYQHVTVLFFFAFGLVCVYSHALATSGCVAPSADATVLLTQIWHATWCSQSFLHWSRNKNSSRWFIRKHQNFKNVIVEIHKAFTCFCLISLQGRRSYHLSGQDRQIAKKIYQFLHNVALKTKNPTVNLSLFFALQPM